MEEKRPLGITLIGGFYVFGALVLIITLFTNATDKFGIAFRFGLPNIPEDIMRIVVSIVFLVMAFGYLRFAKWAFWLMITYTVYFLAVSIILSQQYNEQIFYGNAIWSSIVLVYTLTKRKYFYKDKLSS
ncbi:hypothetical protein CLHOM_34080 [Clostridium homopropionicum DSM 5847]|uniref:Uncharacterized protein n=1 Tax=Clostridium homopropionicum DSM 5847 TaxID=1121318 RepID=A0A0L6Z6C1_9CLOT|nr:hypothetical protein [Clostridium homopropionicum]KOA18506.1 hypothetical protein CLHOM_34080 [Clostridium homopropionicum DSM 5847]SFF65700.1 hypothetical protein SAMN04488501_10172 [Clostridium homopropionicum]